MTAFSDKDLGSLTEEQILAADALVAGAGCATAAAAAGVSDRTLRRWRQQPAFREVLRIARREAFGDVLAAVRAAMADAARALQAVAADEQAPPQARVNAARALLDLGLRSIGVSEAADDKQDTAVLLAGALL